MGLPTPPTPETLLTVLKESTYCIVAQDRERVVGFITAITDKHLSAYIPFLEVLPEYQKRGIGKELVLRMIEILKQYYMIDLSCDAQLQPFYESLGIQKMTGMMLRNYMNQDGFM